MRFFAFALGIALVASATAGCRSAAPRTDCTSTRDCSAHHLVCAIERGYCVACVADADCLSESRACVGYQCVTVTPCTSSVECPGGVCDTTRGRCAECLSERDCDAGDQCTPDGACVAPCTSDAICSSHGLVCDTSSSTCVECVRDADCGMGFTCAGSHCAEGTVDSGGLSLDAGPTPDGGMTPDSGPPPTDGGSPPIDAAHPGTCSNSYFIDDTNPGSIDIDTCGGTHPRDNLDLVCGGPPGTPDVLIIESARARLAFTVSVPPGWAIQRLDNIISCFSGTSDCSPCATTMCGSSGSGTSGPSSAMSHGYVVERIDGTCGMTTVTITLTPS